MSWVKTSGVGGHFGKKGRNDAKKKIPMKVATTGSVCFFHKKNGH